MNRSSQANSVLQYFGPASAAVPSCLSGGGALIERLVELPPGVGPAR